MTEIKKKNKKKHAAHSHLNTSFACWKTCWIHSAISQVSELILNVLAHELGRADCLHHWAFQTERTLTYIFDTLLFKMICCFNRSAIILNIALLSFSRVFFCYLVTEASSYFLFPPLFIAFSMRLYLESTVFICTNVTADVRGDSVIRNCIRSIK